MADISDVLQSELSMLDGICGHNPDTGRAAEVGSLLSQYSTNLFGAPFQLLDSVDKRFSNINKNVGSEYLRHFLLNSPILHIRPGLPKYTGRDETLGDVINDMYLSSSSGGSAADELLLALAKSTIFGSGSKLQRRMFGFRETYLDYMSHVNYMCRSVAIYLGLSEKEYGTFIAKSNGSTDFEPFYNIRWENYRMISTYVNTVTEQLRDMMKGVGGDIGNIWDNFTGSIKNTLNIGNENEEDIDHSDDIQSQLESMLGENAAEVESAFNALDSRSTLYDAIDEKVKSVAFLVEPVAFTENLSNNTDKSMIESMVDKLDEGLGSELAFITNSHADTGILGSITGFLGDVTGSAVLALNDLVEPVTGGFMNNVFTGAVNSLKGQKMIFPEIYKSSNSTMDYEFSVTLTSPYGDVYNYYVNIIVPLLHLIGLAAPRLVSSNSTASPFLVQAYIPGMCTCQLGIISQMNIIKNPTTKHVSVHGFPLTVKVTFTIKELYNAMAISPANDPASFLFNETLNDYLSNLAGLTPSLSTYTQKKATVFENLKDYFTGDDNVLINSAASGMLEFLENRIVRTN